MHDQIRRVLAEHARLPVGIESVADDDDLYEIGMTSLASVNVMLALEDTFDLELPDEMLTRTVFSSIRSIAAALGTVGEGS